MAAGAAQGTELPPLSETLACGSGPTIRLCAKASAGCFGSDCVPVGVPWICPSGFVQAATPTAPGRTVPSCTPDPDDCGTDEYGGVSEAPTARFVNGAAAKGGDGSRAKPFVTIAEGVAAAPAGGAVAIAAGTYVENIQITKPLLIAGRCAAQVIIQGPMLGPIVYVKHAAGSGKVTLRRLRITGEGNGVALVGAGDSRLERVAITAVSGTGLSASAGTFVLTRSLIAPFMSKGGMAPGGMGVEVVGSAHATIEEVRISSARQAGMFARGKEVVLEARSVLIDGMRDHPTAVAGSKCLLADTAAQVDLRSLRCTDFGQVGVALFGDGTHGVARGLLVDGAPDLTGGAQSGLGLQIVEGAHLELYGARLSGNRGFGALVKNAGTTVKALGLLIDGTRPLDANTPGYGMGLYIGCRLDLIGGRLTDNRAAGLIALGKGAVVHATNLQIDGTRSFAKTWPGLGLSLDLGAQMTLLGGTIANNEVSGMGVGSVGTSLVAAGMLLADTRPRQSDMAGGSGAIAQSGAALRLNGSTVRHNTYIGLGFERSGSAVMAGCLVEQTQVGVIDSEYGTAISAFEGEASLELIASRLANNATAGLSLHQTQGSVVDSVIIDTVAANFVVEDLNRKPGDKVDTVVMGDGIVALGTRPLHVERCVVSTQPRAGLLIQGAMAAEVRRSRFTAGLWGIADQDGAELVLVQTLLDHNTSNRGSDAGLVIPLPPVLAQ